jgi:hypothetical protein
VRGRRETPLELAERIGDAYGLVLVLVMITFVVMMTLPPEGWGGRVAAVAVAALTSIVGLTSSDVRPARVRMAIGVGSAAVLGALIAEAIPSDRLLGIAFGAAAICWRSRPSRSCAVSSAQSTSTSARSSAR